MAGKISVLTERVRTAATNISSRNDNIRDALSTPETANNRLNAAWNSPSSYQVLQQFYTIKSNLEPARYAVMNQYVNFLRLQVGDGYDQTEQVNTALADAFKEE